MTAVRTDRADLNYAGEGEGHPDAPANRVALAPRVGSPEWLEWRLGGYGASEAPVLVAGDQDAWWRLHARKLRLVDPEDVVDQTDSMRWGLLLEDAIAAAYAEHPEGAPVVRVNRPLVHPERPHIRASLDRRRKRGRVVVELKKWGFVTEDFGLSGSSQVPEHWVDQVQLQLAVTGYDQVDIAVLFAGGSGRDPFRVYHIGRDQARINAILDVADAAWAYVARGEMPPWPGPAPTRLRLADDELVADPELAALLTAGYQARINKQQAEKADKALTAEILERIGDYVVVRGAAVDVTAKPNRDGDETDWKLIAAAYRKAIGEHQVDVDCDAIESMFTRTKPGARPLRYVPKEVS